MAVAALMGIAILSVISVAQWDESFNGLARRRLAAVSALPPGRMLTIDGAAWRWLSGRPSIVSPADGLEKVACELRRLDPRVLVLEPAHFSAYAERYATGSPRADVGGVKVFDYRSECEIARR